MDSLSQEYGSLQQGWWHAQLQACRAFQDPDPIVCTPHHPVGDKPTHLVVREDERLRGAQFLPASRDRTSTKRSRLIILLCKSCMKLTFL